jgi:carboxyl-terminal processing protease
VVPDVRFPVSVDATEYGESTYDNALPWTRIAPVAHVRYGNFAPIIPQLDALHAARVAKDKEFQWWSQDVAEFRADQAKKYVSLNETERRVERDRQAAKEVDRQAQRKLLGLDADPLADDVADDGLQSGERDIVAETAREKAAEKRPDPLLRESAAILADATNLLVNDQHLTAQVLPESQLPTHWAQ